MKNMTLLFFKFYKKLFPKTQNTILFNRAHLLYIVTVLVSMLLFFYLIFKFAIIKISNLTYLEFMNLYILFSIVFYIYEDCSRNRKLKKFKKILLMLRNEPIVGSKTKQR
jgi:hypothetical protein